MRLYETLIPQKFVLDNGKIVSLTSKDVESMKEPLFLIYIPKSPQEIYEYLKGRGFVDAKLAVKKGEVFSLRRLLDHPWELHVRIYKNGFVDGEVEVRREFIEHLSRRRLFVVYEIYDHVKDICNLHILYKPEGRWVVRIETNFVVRLDPPEKLTPWKPLVICLSLATLLIAKRLKPKL